MKKFLCALAAFLLLFVSSPALAYNQGDKIDTQYVAFAEAGSGTLLVEKNANERAFPASTTKIMTLILALENGSLDDTVTVGKEVDAFGRNSSLMGIHAGETLTLRDLIYGMMLVSGNDAAAAIAVHIGGSISGFADMMNQKAAELNMTNTNFLNPHGRHEDNHYTTAADMVKLVGYALQNEDFRAIVKKDVFDVPATNKDSDGYHLENTNRLLYTKADSKDANMEYPYAIGIKTGETNQAGFCLVSAAEKDGVTFIAVQFNAPDKDYRFSLAKDLFDWGFSSYRTLDVSTLSLPAQVEVSVKNCSFDDETGGLLKLNVDLNGKQISCLAEEMERIRNNVSAITTSVATVGEIIAPVREGDLLATVSYKFEGRTLFTADAYASRDVAQMGGGVVETPDVRLMDDPVSGGTHGPWPFIILVVLLILFVTGLLSYLKNRRHARRRKARRVTYAYRGRR
ncbi:MAG TPA: D-alanyl-D-alanine carboxypeptidase family protein [Feifaniaceae bacterium]|nr:D-alanyl-D-alanine carboxypeptidase family protein [Feifaniaceae bacterium]